MYSFDFTYEEYQRLLERCPFTDLEKQIIEYRRKGESNIYICMNLNISQATLTRKILKILKKIQKEID